MRPLDTAILVAYLGTTLLIGLYFSRRQRNVYDYFVGGRTIPWWVVTGSIVATETSTVTFISVPGFAFGADLTFLQLALGYLAGRIVVMVLFVPAYFRGKLLTVYQLLGTRFGNDVRRLIAAGFLLTRSLSDGIRLFATGLVFAALLLALPGGRATMDNLAPGIDGSFIALLISVLIIGVVTMVYTYVGGMAAVVWTDCIQLIVYLSGAGVAALILLNQIPGGWAEVVRVAGDAGKFRVFDFTWDPTRSYTFWSGLIGGALLSTATHGTDQLMVQRYLSSRSPREARLALLTSGVLVFAQFALFLIIGLMLYVFYSGPAASELAGITLNGQIQTDRLIPHFIVTRLPSGLVGLVLASVFAAAMSTLSSSLNSSSATALVDFYLPWSGGQRSATHYLRVSRLLTAVWGGVQIVIALAAIRLSSNVVDEVLGIASFTNGIILGVFLLGTLTQRVGQRAALVGIVAGVLTVGGLRVLTMVSWQWYVLVGAAATFAAGLSASYIMGDEAHRRRHVEDT